VNALAATGTIRRMPGNPRKPPTDTADAQSWQKTDDRFVPLRACELIDAMCADTRRFGDDADALRSVSDALLEVIERQTDAFERVLLDGYHRVNPDRDTIPVHTPDATDERSADALLVRQIEYLLDKANFERLSDAQIEEAIAAANSYGLKVRLRPERVQHLSIWVRGRGRARRNRKSLRHPLRGETSEVSNYRRLVVVVRLVNEPHLVLKLFKDIPIEDIEALLPHAEIKMNWLDRLMMLGGGAGAAGTTGWKIITMASKVLIFSKILWVLLVGAATILVRTILGYRRAKDTRDSQRTRHLYYQNLTNNAGVLHSLLALVAQEELKEALLAYAWIRAAPGQHDTPALRTRVQRYLFERFGVEVDFDTADAVESLTRLNLWRNAQQAAVVEPIDAIARLQAHAHASACDEYHLRRASRFRMPTTKRTPR